MHPTRNLSISDSPPPLPPRPSSLLSPPLPAKSVSPASSTSKLFLCSPVPPPLPARPNQSSSSEMPRRPINTDRRLSEISSAIGANRSSNYFPMTEAMEKNRSDVVNELIENETLFRNQMSYISDIMTNGKVPVPISSEDLAAVKLNLDDYIKASAQMVIAYERAVAEAPNGSRAQACVGKHLLPVIPDFCREMIAYIKDFDPQILQHRPHLNEYFQKAGELLRQNDNLLTVLSDRLLKPFQRPFHIMSILGRLGKYTPELHPDSDYVKKAIIAIQKACDDAESSKRENAEYRRSNDSPHSFNEITKSGWAIDGPFENTRMTNYRKKQQKLSTLIDNLISWIEGYNKELKTFMENRRCLIKAECGLLSSLDAVKTVSRRLDFHADSATHLLPELHPDTFNRASQDVTDRLKQLNQTLKKMKNPMKKLKVRAKELSRTRRKSDIDRYRMDEEKAICLSENVLNRSEIVIKSLFLYYLSHVQKFFKFASINASGIVERYKIENAHRILESDVSARINDHIIIWSTRVSTALGNSSPLRRVTSSPMSKVSHRSYTKRSIDYGTSAIGANIVATVAAAPTVVNPPGVTRARVMYSYYDDQTPVELKDGDEVDVVQWNDDLGNPEWAVVRIDNSDFFYPSNRLLPLR